MVNDALNIITACCKHPCVRPFINRFPIDDPIYEDYYAVISRPICLNDIKERVEMKKYSSWTEFERDIKLIWTNIKQISEPTDPLLIMAEELQRLYGKYSTLYTTSSLTKWTRQFSQMSLKVQMKLQKMPDFCAVMTILRAPCLLGIPMVPIESTNVSKDLLVRPLAEIEMLNFMEAIRNLTSTKDAKELVKIIYEEENSINIHHAHLDINLSVLQPYTIRRLISYTKSRMKEMGLAYPE